MLRQLMQLSLVQHRLHRPRLAFVLRPMHLKQLLLPVAQPPSHSLLIPARMSLRMCLLSQQRQARQWSQFQHSLLACLLQQSRLLRLFKQASAQW